ncbi:hypothetical protein F3K02_03205 [Hydrogenophaga sp. D2P1]|uniref:Uncharacterized protein n=1 Tax=Hydrogenophaga aromaticivorans TaxID=2610898 RepID=A0A7Y8KVP0_9BURK|nr:hypothetical protein [Hydrogenophaga aromaticivorans]NWF44264.1 hypothetical protein [Hydrogenophaga aromaticivorans]
MNSLNTPNDMLREMHINRRQTLTMLPLVGAIGSHAVVASAEVQTESVYLTTEEVLKSTVPKSLKRISTSGFTAPHDGGAAVWIRVSKQPQHPGYITDASDSIFEIDENVLLPEMFGALGDIHDDYFPIQRSVTVAALTKRRLEFRGARYSISDEIIVPADAEKFSLVGLCMTELVQLSDNKSIFLFSGENTHHWTISGFRFLWQRNQTPANRNAYAVRFATNRPGGAGHWNFEISNCILVNGFRGFGQSDNGHKTLLCPIWGAAFRRIHMSQAHSGAAIFLRTFGKSGQPNNRIEEFYARCDHLSEPAIIIESADTAVLTSIEFNRGTGCQLLLESCSNFVVQGIRFEHVGLGSNGAYIVASGRHTNIQLLALSIQSMELAAGGGAASALVRAMNGARVKIDGFTDMPWRAPSAMRYELMHNTVAVADAQGGHITVGFIAPLFDPALTLARIASESTVRFTEADSYDFFFEGNGKPVFSRKFVRQRAGIVAVGIFAEGISDDILRGFVLYSDGKPILSGRKDLGQIFDLGKIIILPKALRSQELPLILTTGGLLSLSLPVFTPAPQGYTVMVSLIAVGI